MKSRERKREVGGETDKSTLTYESVDGLSTTFFTVTLNFQFAVSIVGNRGSGVVSVRYHPIGN